VQYKLSPAESGSLGEVFVWVLLQTRPTPMHASALSVGTLSPDPMDGI
jgi:hypothetical protein